MKLLKVFIFLFPVIVFSQEIDINGSINTKVILANEDENPFWFHTNTNYAVSELSNISINGNLNGSVDFSTFKINAGASIFGRDGVEHAVQREDLYLQFENSWLFATIGSKKQEEVLDGLSATNQDFLWSGNARPLPGILLEANNPLKISKTFALDWAIAHYELNDDRYVEGTHVHYKKLGLITTINENHKITAQVQHYAQWGGTSPEYGKLKNGFKDYWNVFFARTQQEIGLDGEIQNRVGNHLGSISLEYEFNATYGDFSFYHDHYIEDGSGSGFKNFPDGLWGVYFKPKKQNLISAILYEYIDTSDQSGATGGSGRDNYFSNSIYRSGWTYDENVIGVPFIVYNKNLPLTTNETRFISTRAKTHHLGISGNVKMLEWQLKSTYSKYMGTYGQPLNPEWEYWYNYGSVSYKNEKLGTFKVLGGLDFSNVTNTVIGGGIEYQYTF